MQTLAARVHNYIRRHQLLVAGDRTAVAVSGGADSVALLRLLLELRAELGIVLSVVHVNHQLRGEDSQSDAKFVAELAGQHGLDLHQHSVDVAAYAAKEKMGLEAAGRAVRYQFFNQLLQQGQVNRIATGHTLDDQAETVLLRIVRGAGTRGMAGIYPKLSVPGSADAAIIRPLLGTSRKELLQYLQTHQQPWKEDSSNRDLRFARNRVRHGILPRLEKSLNPSIKETLAEAAEIARAEEEIWETYVNCALGETWNLQEGKLKIPPLLVMPLALRRRVMRSAAESLGLRLQFRHVNDLLDLFSSVAKSVALPRGWMVTRRQGNLYFLPPDNKLPADYEYVLTVPGRVSVPETGTCFEAALVSVDAKAGYNRGNLLDPKNLGSKLAVRNWRAGDRFSPAHTKSAKKVKELLQRRHVAGAERKAWPVVVNGKEIIWMRGFSPPLALQPRESSKRAVLIQELAL